MGAIAAMSKTLKLICGLVILAAMSHATEAADDQSFRITTLSSRPDMVSGGEVLIQIVVPRNVPFSGTTVKLNGRDVTSVLSPEATAHELIGLVTGLRLGDNLLEVFNSPKETVQASQLALKNFPST